VTEDRIKEIRKLQESWERMCSRNRSIMELVLINIGKFGDLLNRVLGRFV
jgi:hypothetical protein